MAQLGPARRAALSLVSQRRRRAARVRDLARADKTIAGLSVPDRALAFRLAMGATAAEQVLDALVDERLRRPSALEPRVRDALRVAAFEICYLDTPVAVAASQGVELVRSVAPRAVGLANAVLRRLAQEARPLVEAARDRCVAGTCDAGDLSLASGLPAWLAARLLRDRGSRAAASLCLAQLDAAPVYVAANTLRQTPEELVHELARSGMRPTPVPGLVGSFELGDVAPLASSGLVPSGAAVVADLAAQLVCRIAAPDAGGAALLEVGQGRATKSILLCTAAGVRHPSTLVGVDSVAYKVRVAGRRMREAGLSGMASSHRLDACELAGGGEGLPEQVDRLFDVVLVDAPCSGTGTMRRHPEIAASLAEPGITELAGLQLRMLQASAARVAPGGVLVYATCSVLPEEDEQVVRAFLESASGRCFRVEDVATAPACRRDVALGQLVAERQTPEGFLLTIPSPGDEDGHFCARMVRVR